MVFEARSLPLFQAGEPSEEVGWAIWLEGELDLSSIGDLEEALSSALQNDPPVIVVDLRGLSFMDSTGIKWLLTTGERCRADGRRLVLVPGGRPIERIFEISGVEDRFEFMTKEEAFGLPAGDAPANTPGVT